MKPKLFARDFTDITQPSVEWTVGNLKWADAGGPEMASLTAVAPLDELYRLSALMRARSSERTVMVCAL